MPETKTNISLTECAEDAALEHERLTSLVGSMVDGVIAVDHAGKIVLYNGAALNILDSNSAIKNKPLYKVFNLYDKNNQPVDIHTLVKKTTKATISRDYKIKYQDGSYVSLYFSIAPVHQSYGKNTSGGHVMLLRDITREKSLEEERDEFIGVVSHELRTPIAIAEGNLSNALFLCERSGDIQDVKAALKESHNQTLFLASMINDLSTLSRAERGKLALEVESINIHDLVKELHAAYTPQAALKGLNLDVLLHDHLELLYSSKLYVREILQNFITNALKYTDKGQVTIGAKPGPKGTYVWVEDTGIGISKNDLEKVYDKFFRSEDFRTRKNSGTGLGLYVTMKLARMLHAEIEAKSHLNKGSIFTIYFPNLK